MLVHSVVPELKKQRQKDHLSLAKITRLSQTNTQIEGHVILQLLRTLA